MNLRFRRGVVPFVLSSSMIFAACEGAQGRSEAAPASPDPDSMGVAPTSVATVKLRSSRGLVENSGAAMSATQPGVLFSINDSGNEAVLYAVDTLGADRGTWRVKGSSDVDWEAVAMGRCADGTAPRCVYIGDTGDNDDAHTTRAIYRVGEPQARDSAFRGEVTAERISYTYPDQAHDVEAMYVASSGDIYLITKRPLKTRSRQLRPALVFRISGTAWSDKRPIVAQLVDSLSLVPGSAPLRTITDAALSPNGRYLAVRTYSQVYTYAIDPATGRVDHGTPPALCDIVSLGEPQGEGITWADDSGRLVFSSEGHDAPLHLANCPLPR